MLLYIISINNKGAVVLKVNVCVHILFLVRKLLAEKETIGHP